MYPEVAGKDVPLQSYHANSAVPDEEQDDYLPPTLPRSYCGKSKKLLVIVLIAAVVVVAIVGGAVGGTLSSRKASKNVTSDPSIASCIGSQ